MNRVESLPLDQIRRCAADPDFLATVDALYADLDAEIAGNSPVCSNRGACCKFGAFGHRLFVTPVELACFLARTIEPIQAPSGPDACPYQQEGLCTARQGRPVGCRIFFCEPASAAWQGPLTERTLGRLKELHARFDLPYAYVDWTQALGRLTQV